MVKTQIQLPDSLYQDLKRVAKEREISLAEVIRRGAEYITQVYRPLKEPRDDWTLPGPFDLGVEIDLFADPDWRYDLHASHAAPALVREKKRSKVEGKRKKKP